MDDFARLSGLEKRPYFEAAAANAGHMSEYIIEKDFWVCWMLKRLFNMPLLEHNLIFKGGTSLSKVFRVIERFSEDIDLSVSRELLGFGGDRDPEKAESSKQQNKRIEDLAQACKEFIATKLHSELTRTVSLALGTSNKWKLSIDSDDKDGQTLLFEYPTSSKMQDTYINPVVKIELGARSDHWPAHEHLLRPYVADYVVNALKLPDAKVKTLDAARTFWEKATILHSYAHYPEEKTPSERQSRHYYDMFKLLQSKHKTEAMGDLKLLARVAEHKSVYFRAGWAKYNEAKKGTLKIIPSKRVEAIMRRDYEQMQEMIFGDAPSWTDILADLAQFEFDFNQ
jgi:predicted nucleotidyltransferase component of viral defense system